MTQNGHVSSQSTDGRRGAAWRARQSDIDAILSARCGDPFAVLGLHQTEAGFVIRAFAPGAETLEAATPGGDRIAALERVHPDGFFEALIPGATQRFPYLLRAKNAQGAWDFCDPYAFGPALGQLDDHLLVAGEHQKLYERLGAHTLTHEGVHGALFAVWAPEALRVSVVGDFNRWDGRVCQMRKRIDSGVWEIFIPGVARGARYKYEIVGRDGGLAPLKADPFGRAAELRPATASVVVADKPFPWTDDAFLAQRRNKDLRRAPMSIYEVHLPSWRRGPEGRFLTYDELAAELIPYAADLGFTHIELLPISEHPLDASWGYQPIGLFAPTSRHGDPAGFKRFVNCAHEAGLGVILDWAPAHFPTDAHGLAMFDGGPLYEHSDPRRGFHPDWNTAIYDFGRREVANFLIANALYWLDCFHIDGLRVDAVASMLYLDYSRKAGEWAPNPDGSNDNRDAVRFLQRFNELVYGLFPGVVTIAEESTSWAGVSHPTSAGGLGFGFKWNMGWMNDTLAYMATDPVHRKWRHDKLTFGLLYAFSENFVLPLSHDEVVHGKGSIVAKMPGDEWRRFANARAYYGFMWGQPGKKLLFMGQEFGQTSEWKFDQSLEWGLLEYAPHQGLQKFIRDLNRAYGHCEALHARDCESEGFQWIVVEDRDNSVFAFVRYGEDRMRPIVVAANFTPVPRENYILGLPHAGRWRETINSDALEYGGSGRGNLGEVRAAHEALGAFPASAPIVLPPLATLFFEFIPDELE
ncbi:1,4-alpha-glucan branching protein GlgB [Methylocystis heyeri]|uniref:1,4-alpha-glucan branching enzyme GlgB n=1 Tax=Methylocystis heyeri TaxID=391905 RepID=A0A6B8KK49_9HYPH|nr:1,4-alpha-glucan branching protein GlgB [Methylocystis heyeri]QGM46998.1 1,4-alpha-glucan branching protein GlgB [Methylocystis heyeri]